MITPVSPPSHDTIAVDFGPACDVVNRDGAGNVVLVCEHASAAIPDALDALGLSPAARLSHAAFDIGADGLARALSARLDAPLVAACVSRLVCDCNRPPDAADAMPAQVEVHPVPGNARLAAATRAARTAALHDPFHATLGAVLADRPGAALVTVHSFTPVWHGQRRHLEFGLLHGADDRLARALAAAMPKVLKVALNEPYGPDDGVLYTLERHGAPGARPRVMIEVRNDLLPDADAQSDVADMLAASLTQALATLGRGA